ncbi:MAG: thioredoxin family protein [FCB group bacterium]|nr:thioredoxin family protein [FCB group bacterium]
MKGKYYGIIICLLAFNFALMGQDVSADTLKSTDIPATTEKSDSLGQVQSEKPLITFVELGSVNCIPCKKMQPVMKAIEENYTGQVEVIFYDVWQKDQKKWAEHYKILSIPTQVFLDSDGNELWRHMGFLPEKDIRKFLLSHGIKPSKDNGKS